MSNPKNIEKANLCPVATLSLIAEPTEINIAKIDGSHLWILTDTVTAAVKPRRNPIAIVARVAGDINPKSVSLNNRIKINTEQIDKFGSDGNPLQELRDRAFSETVFQHLGTNCLNCVFTGNCIYREELAEQAHHPELRYEQAEPSK